MPARWPPWPVNRTAVRPAGTAPATRRGAGRPAARAASADTRSSYSSPVTTARWVNGDRRVASATARSSGAGGGGAGRLLPQMREEEAALVAQRGRGVPGEHPRQGADREPPGGAAGGRGARCGLPLPRRLPDDHVGVGAADDAEEGHAGAPGPFTGGPGDGVAQQLDVATRPVDVVRRLVEVQGAGQHGVLQRLHHLDDTGRPGGCLGVPDVGLHRAEPYRNPVGAVGAVGGEDGLRLDRVAEPGAGSVPLHDVDVGGGEAGVGEGGADDALLRRPVGGGRDRWRRRPGWSPYRVPGRGRGGRADGRRRAVPPAGRPRPRRARFRPPPRRTACSARPVPGRAAG